MEINELVTRKKDAFLEFQSETRMVRPRRWWLLYKVTLLAYDELRLGSTDGFSAWLVRFQQTAPKQSIEDGSIEVCGALLLWLSVHDHAL